MNQLQPLVALGANVQIDPEQFKRTTSKRCQVMYLP